MAALSRRRSVAQATQKTKRDKLVESRRGIERSILDRLGDREEVTRVVARNIAASISAVDVRALFAAAGTV